MATRSSLKSKGEIPVREIYKTEQVPEGSMTILAAKIGGAELAIVIPPKEYILGLKRWDMTETEQRVTYSLRYFCEAAKQRDPLALALLFAEKDILESNILGLNLLVMRNMFRDSPDREPDHEAIDRWLIKAYMGAWFAKQLQPTPPADVLKKEERVGPIGDFCIAVGGRMLPEMQQKPGTERVRSRY
jgi:hypothetical protein